MSVYDTVRPFLTEVAAPAPPVTGGGVSAVTVAAAAGLVAMTARLSPEPYGGEERAAHAEHLQQRALDLAVSDADAYAPVLTAQRRPRDDPERAGALRDALSSAAGPPRAIAALAADVAEMAAGLAAQGDRSLRGDAVTAATLAAGAARGAAALARVNIASAGVPAEPASSAEEAAAAAQHHADSALRTVDDPTTAP